MTNYAVGDLQGCLDPLKALLDKLAFDPTQDQLIAVGDLVNRGPNSLETLQFCKSLGPAFKTVLGNHDLHLLAISKGVRSATSHDSLTPILSAPDREELLNWLQQQPLLLSVGDYTVFHAGIPPQWDLLTAQRLAAEVSAVLRSKDSDVYFQNMYGNQPSEWREDLEGPDRWRVITNYLTRMRLCTATGALELESKDGLNPAPPFAPWFSFKARKTRNDKLIFGHWAALQGQNCGDNLFALDTGYVWGGPLRIMDMDTQEYFDHR